MKAKQHRTSRMAIAVALLFVLAIAWNDGLGGSSSRAVTYTRVSLSGEHIMQSSVATADLDGNGQKEIVVGGPDGVLYVVAYTGSAWSQVWSRQVAQDLNAAGAPSAGCVTDKSDIRSSPAIADLNNDGHLEIVITTGGDPANRRNGGVLVYTYTPSGSWSTAFSVVPGWPQPKIDQVGLGAGASDPDGCWDGIWGSPALGDLDGDGDLEVAVEGFDRRLHAWHHDGSAVAGWPIYRYNGDALLRGGWSSPAVGDIDGDGLPEVIFGTDSPPWEGEGGPAPDYTKATVWAINGDSTNVPGWPVTTAQAIQSPPALGDIDRDGRLEVVVGTGTGVPGTGGYKVCAWNGDGSPVSGWPRTTAGNMPAPPALGDLDGDGDLEIVIGCGTEADTSCKWLYAWHHDGSSVANFPVQPPYNSWDTGYTSIPFGPVLADYDGDGEVEILVVHRGAFGIATVDLNGQCTNDLDRTRYTLFAPPLVEDVDGDGKVEVVIGGAYTESTSSNGAVYIWDVNGTTDSARPWPMFHHDVRRTGRYELPPRLGFQDEIRMLHQAGSGNTESQSVRIWNEGEGQFDWSITHAIAGLQVLPSAGTVASTTPVQFVVTTAGLATGWNTLGTVTVTGTDGGKAIDGSPITAVVYVYVGDVSRVYLPRVVRNG